MAAGRLQGHVGLVTGSESGIGRATSVAFARATAVAFARVGADVAVTFLHDEEGAEMMREEVGAAGRRAVVLRLDQRDPGAVERVFREAWDALGEGSVLVSNAGVDRVGMSVHVLLLGLAEGNVRVKDVAPGRVWTPFTEKAVEAEEFREKRVQSIPVKRAALPLELAGAVVFLASEDAGCVDGAAWFVDGALKLFQGQGA